MRKIKYLLISIMTVLILPAVVNAEIKVVFPKNIEKGSRIEITGIEDYKFYYRWKNDTEQKRLNDEINDLTNQNAGYSEEISAAQSKIDSYTTAINVEIPKQLAQLDAYLDQQNALLAAIAKDKAARQADYDNAINSIDNDLTEIAKLINNIINNNNLEFTSIQKNSNGEYVIASIDDYISNFRSQIDELHNQLNLIPSSQSSARMEIISQINNLENKLSRCETLKAYAENYNRMLNTKKEIQANYNLDEADPITESGSRLSEVIAQRIKLAELLEPLIEKQKKTFGGKITEYEELKTEKQNLINTNNITIASDRNELKKFELTESSNSTITEIMTTGNNLLIIEIVKGNTKATAQKEYNGTSMKGEDNTVIATTKKPITGTELNIQIGKVIDLSNNIKNAKWTSSDETIASVDQNGKVTAKKVGKVTITAENETTLFTNVVNVYKEVKSNDTDGVSILVNDELKDKDIKIKVEKISETSEIFKKIKNKIQNLNKMTMYNVDLMLNNTKIQPNGEVILEFDIPSGYDKSKLAVFRVEDDESLTRLIPVTIIGDKIQVKTNHFSYYVVAELSEKTNTNIIDSTVTDTTSNADKTTKTTENPKTGQTISIVVVSILTIAATTIYLYTKKKNALYKI